MLCVEFFWLKSGKPAESLPTYLPTFHCISVMMTTKKAMKAVKAVKAMKAVKKKKVWKKCTGNMETCECFRCRWAMADAIWDAKHAEDAKDKSE